MNMPCWYKVKEKKKYDLNRTKGDDNREAWIEIGNHRNRISLVVSHKMHKPCSNKQNDIHLFL